MAKPWERNWSQPSRPLMVRGPEKEPAPQTAVQAEGDVLGNELKRNQLRDRPLDNDYKRTQISNATIDNEAKLRSEYNQLPSVREFQSALPKFVAATRASDNPVGDMQIITAWVKAYDPTGAVMTGDVQTAEQAQSAYQKITGQSQALFNGSGRLTPQVRANFLREIHTRLATLGDAYRQERKNYSNIAGRTPGVNPQNVIGDPFQAQFQQAEADYLHRPVRNLDGSQGPMPHGQQPQGPGDIGFAGVERPDGMSPQQQAAYDAWWAVNPDPTPQQLEAFALSIGQRLHNAQDIIDAKKRGYGVRPAGDAVVVPPDISDRRTDDNQNEVEAAARGFANVPLMGFDQELYALSNTVQKGGTYADNLRREKAIDAFDQEHNGISRFGGQLAGGLVLPGFGARSIPQIAAVGAGYGAGYGLGSTDGGLGERLGGAVKGGIAGGVAGAGLAAGAPLLGRGIVAAGRRAVGPSTPRQTALLNAATEEGVPINMGDIYHGSLNTLSTLETIPGASGIVRDGIGEGRDAIASRVQSLGRGGTAREDMGQVVQGAGERFIQRSGAQATKLYDRARSLAADTPITPQETMQTLSQLVREESAVPGGTSAGAVIGRYADAFSKGGTITIDGARRMRSELLRSLRNDAGLTQANAQRITGTIMGSVTNDIERSLTQAGRGEAAQAFRQADAFYAERMNQIQDVIQRFTGNREHPKSAEQALAMMQSMAGPKGDSGRLAQMLRHLTPEERQDYAATLVESLGRMSPDEPFSPARFIQNVRSISPAARRLIFGADGERSIQNLVRLSNAKKETVARLNNSRSGQVGNYRTVLSSLLFGVPGGGAMMSAATGLNFSTGTVGAAAIAGTGLAASRGLARALMSENFTRLLAQAPNTANPAAINAHFGRLRQLATKEPHLRGVIESLEQSLLSAVNDNAARVGSAAASPDERPDQQQRR